MSSRNQLSNQKVNLTVVVRSGRKVQTQVLREYAYILLRRKEGERGRQDKKEIGLNTQSGRQIDDCWANANLT